MHIHPTKRLWIGLVGLMLIVTQLACASSSNGKKSNKPTDQPTIAVSTKASDKPAVEPSETAEATQPATQPGQSPENTAAPAKPPAAGGADMACVGSFEFGMGCLDANGWSTYNKENSNLGANMVLDMALCPDQRVLVAHTLGISAFDGKEWSSYDQGWGSGSVNAVACDAQGGIWVAHFKGVSYYDNQNWKTYPSGELASGDSANDLVEDVEVAPNGTVWVMTSNSVASFDGEKWNVFQQGQGFKKKYYFSKLTVDGQNAPWVAYSDGVASYDGKNWKEYKNNKMITVESLAVDAQNRVWVGTFSSGIFILDKGKWVSHNRKSAKFGSDHIYTISFDAGGRAWIGSEYGLVVFDGKEWATYRMDNSDLIDNNVRHLVVLGNGPALPAPAEKPTGSMSGKLVTQDGQPLTGLNIEVCVEDPGMFYQKTPCSGQALIKAAKTDEEGKFSITDLPAGLYVLTVNNGKNWTILTADIGIGSKRILVEPGKNTYVGELKAKDE